MILVRLVSLALAVCLLFPASLPAQSPFSLDSARSYLKTIAVDIGPRPMGSPAERRAMDFALAKFQEFGMTETGILPMRTATRGMGGAVNTSSGAAYGILRGKTSRIIVLGGHIDSASPDIPGANDDGSGSAAVVELARVLSQRDNESTIVFALFGGEEQGLKGSQHFVQTFPLIDQVVLMIQLDMTNGSDVLIPLIDADGRSAPRWLVTAAYEEAGALGITGLSYPTHFLTLNNALPGGGIGSDHMPFLQHGIAAIDFTSDINDPIHTPQDSYAQFLPSGLKRSGDLAYRLVLRFDAGVPEETSDHYWLVQVASTPIFVAPGLVAAFVILSVLAGIVALVIMRRRRTDEPVRMTIPGLKLFLLLLIIQSFVWLSESVVEWITGDRFPWYDNSSGFVWLGFSAALVGIWVSMILGRRLGLTRDPYRYGLRATIVFLVFIAFTALGSMELALYPATALLLTAAAFLVRTGWIRFLLWLASPYLMIRLVFSEGFGLLSRATTLIPPGLGIEILYHGALILFFSIWSFPFLLSFASLRFDSSLEFLKLRWLTSRTGRIASVLACLGLVLWLSLRPSYSERWQQIITIHQSLQEGEPVGDLSVKSSEYLDGTRVRWDDRDTLIDERTTEAVLGQFPAPSLPWINAERTIEFSQDSLTRVSLFLKLTTIRRPYQLSLQYRSGRDQLRDVSSPFVSSVEGNSVVFNWYSFPDSVMTIPIAFTVAGSEGVQETISATFKQPIIQVAVDKPLSTPVIETEVVRIDTLRFLRGEG